MLINKRLLKVKFRKIETPLILFFIALLLIMGTYIITSKQLTRPVILPLVVPKQDLCTEVDYAEVIIKGVKYILCPQKNTTPKEAGPSADKQGYAGKASYYSRSGCVGCSKTLTMANGEQLDDNALTVAFNRLPLGSLVKILNPLTNLSVIAKVTDRGGFEKLGRIIDMSVAVKNAIKCGSLCDVKVYAETR